MSTVLLGGMVKGQVVTRAIRRAGAAGLIASALAGPAAAETQAGKIAWDKGDYPKAVAEWREPAVAGDPNAQFDLGQAYKLGRGVPVDLSQAVIWYARAATQNHPMAIDDLGLVLFTQGRRADALPWLEKSAARDERRAEYVLGTMLFNGDAAARDWVRAYALITRASQQGLTQAGPVLSELDGYVSPEQREQGTALAGRIAAGADDAETRAPPVVIAAAAPPAVTGRANTPAPAGPKPRPTPRAAATLKPIAPSKLPSTPTPAATGRYRIQLGAFKNEVNARTLWAKVGGKAGGQPSYVKAGGITRLQAGPFGTENDAKRACKASEVACDVVAAK